MALIMARPWGDPKTGVLHLRQRTPRDLLPRVKGRLIKLPIGAGFASVRVGDTVQVSLRTKDARRGKELHVVADGALRGFWEAERNGPGILTHRYLVALAGDWHRALLSEYSDDPGDPLGWETNAHIIIEALESADTSAPREEALARLLRIDDFLASRGLKLAARSRAAFIREAASAHIRASQQLERNAVGDYRPDPTLAFYPSSIQLGAGVSGTREVLTVSNLFDRWAAYQEDKKAPNTIRRYGASLRSLAAFAKDRDTRSLTGDDLYAWAEHRRDVEGVSARAINRNDLVAASSVFSWAMKRQGGRLLEMNPAKGVHLDEPRTTQKRERTFRAAVHFPPGAIDRDELPNALIEL